MISKHGSTRVVERGKPRLSVFGNHGHNGFQRNRVPIQQIRTVAGDHHLYAFARFQQHVRQYSRRRGMESAFRFLDADQERIGRLHAHALIQRHQHPRNTQGSIRYVVGEESPGMLVATNLLAKLECKLGSHRLRVHAYRAGNHPERF